MNDKITDAVEAGQNRIVVRTVYGISATLGLVFVSACGWVFMEVLESRQFRMSGDRYTQQDALNDKASMLERITDIVRDLERIKVKVEKIEEASK